MKFHSEDRDQNRPLPQKRTGSWLIGIIILLLLAGLAGAWLFSSPKEQVADKEHAVAPVEVAEQTDQNADTNLSTRAETEKAPAEELSTQKEETLTAPIEVQELTEQQQCEQLAAKLLVFFSHLDSEPYIADFQLNQPSLQYFNELKIKLLANPPVVTRESDDLYTILTNMAHFFRIIGRQNILLMKSILDRERDKIEDVAADLYRWTVVKQCNSDSFQMNAPLDRLYEYAGFFLNTMGGRSYLFRRDSRSRLLVNYYAILIVDRTNTENMNRYGLDIKEIIPRLIQEIEATNQLIYKEDYIDRLLDLQEKYQ